MPRKRKEVRKKKVRHHVVPKPGARYFFIVCPICGTRRRRHQKYAEHVPRGGTCGKKECRYEHIARTQRYWTHERIIAVFQKLANKLGRTPTRAELNELVSWSLLVRRFGSVRQAALAAGLTPRRQFSGQLTDAEWWEKHHGTSTFPLPIPTTARPARHVR